MKPLAVEFLRPRGLGLWRWILVILMCAAALYAVAQAGQSYWQLRERQDAVAKLVASAAQSVVQPPAVLVRAPDYERSARDMLAAAQAPWPEILVSLETVSVTGVKVSSVEIQNVERIARLELEAESFAVMLKYLDELNAGEPPLLWQLQSAENQAGPTGLVSGQVRGRIWRRF